MEDSFSHNLAYLFIRIVTNIIYLKFFKNQNKSNGTWKLEEISILVRGFRVLGFGALSFSPTKTVDVHLRSRPCTCRHLSITCRDPLVDY